MPESNRPHVVGSVGRYGGLPPVAVLRRPVMGHRWWVGVLDDARPRIGLKPVVGVEPTRNQNGWSGEGCGTTGTCPPRVGHGV